MNKSKDKKILVVDDNLEMCKLIEKVLIKEGYEIIIASNGEEALDKVKNKKDIKLVIADIKMPKKDGVNLLKEIQEDYPTIKVILMTAYGDVEQYLQMMDMGAYEYMPKPIKIDELVRVVKKAMK
jgi:DNA-binding NtrC family response regulator